MSYRISIETLVESLKLLEQRIDSLSKDPNHDKLTMMEAIQQKTTLKFELSRLNKLQWEEDNDRIDFDDDR